MSVPEHQENIPHVVCACCGKEISIFQIPVCKKCKSNLDDMYADEKISEGRRR